MRGILVGVSFGNPDIAEPDNGGSFGSFEVDDARLLTPTEGEPAIVGNCVRLLKEVSDCFCMELAVCDVALEDEDVDRGVTGVVEEGDDGVPPDLSLATR